MSHCNLICLNYVWGTILYKAILVMLMPLRVEVHLFLYVLGFILSARGIYSVEQLLRPVTHVLLYRFFDYMLHLGGFGHLLQISTH